MRVFLLFLLHSFALPLFLTLPFSLFRTCSYSLLSHTIPHYCTNFCPRRRREGEARRRTKKNLRKPEATARGIAFPVRHSGGHLPVAPPIAGSKKTTPQCGAPPLEQGCRERCVFLHLDGSIPSLTPLEEDWYIGIYIYRNGALAQPRDGGKRVPETQFSTCIIYTQGPMVFIASATYGTKGEHLNEFPQFLMASNGGGNRKFTWIQANGHFTSCERVEECMSGC